MSFETPLWVQGDGTLEYSAREFRRLIEALSRPGVFRPETGALAVTRRAAGANFSVDVAAGQCAIEGTSQAGQGYYLATNDAVVNVPVSAAPGANSRIDLVVARVSAVESGPVVLEAVEGSAASSPVAPTLPDDAVALAQILIASTDAAVTDAMITDLREDASVVSDHVAAVDPHGDRAYADAAIAEATDQYAARILMGSYVGDGGLGQDVALPFVPIMVMVSSAIQGGFWAASGVGPFGAASVGIIAEDDVTANGSQHVVPVLNTNQFTVSDALNTTGVTYRYMVLGAAEE